MLIDPTKEAIQHAQTIKRHLEDMRSEGAPVESLIEQIDGQIDKLNHTLIYGDFSVRSEVQDILNSYKETLAALQIPLV